MAETYGYIRISSTDQNEGRQRMAFEQKAIPPDHIFMDKLSGKDFQRPQYQALLTLLKPGDQLVHYKQLIVLDATMRKYSNSGDFLPRKSGSISSSWICLCWIRGATRTCSVRS